MAFATKYTLTWKDIEDVEWEIYFQEDGYSGGTTALEPGSTPCTLTWNQSEKYQAIVGSCADIQMVYETNIDDLFTDESQFVYVIVYKNSNRVWRGFITPGQYQRNFNQPKHYVTITATDGLGDLKNIKFEDSSGDPYFYQADEMTVLYNCLLKTGMDITIISGINIYEDNQDSLVDDDPLDQTYIYPDMYWDEQTDKRSNCDVVIEDILRKYGATIRQVSGLWYILRPNSFVADFLYYRIIVGGVVDDNDGLATFISVDEDNYYIYANQEITRLMGYGGCEITQDPPRRSNMFKNGSFDGFTWTGGIPDYWANSASAPSYSEVSDALRMRCNQSVAGALPTKYIETSVLIHHPSSINISFEWTPTYTGSPSYKSLVLQIYDGTYYLTTSGWQSGVGYYTIAAGLLGSGTKKEVSIPIPEQFAYGYDSRFTLRFRVYEFHNENLPASNYVTIDNLRLEVGMTTAETKLHTYDNPITINNIKEETIAIGDSWITDLYASETTEDAYYINTYDTSFSLTEGWSIMGDQTASTPLCELLARQYVEGYRKGLDMFHGYIRSDSLLFSGLAFEDSNLKDDYGFNKRFFPNGIAYNTRLNEWNGEWAECPATYTDEELEWDSENFGTAGTITGNELEIVYYEITSTSELGVFESYTTITHETLRFVVNIVDRGAADVLPTITISDGVTPHTQSVSWGLNYLTYVGTGANAVTLVLSGAVGEILDITCTVDVYSITGI